LQTYEIIVIGMGAMGSAAAFQLAARGHRVLGLEQFGIPHDRGSSHGVSRIIRFGYSEDPSYVPLLYRARELWRQAEEASGYSLLHVTGSIDAGPVESVVFAGALRSCQIHNLPHEILDNRELAKRFPALQLPKQIMAVLQPEGGFLEPELCISAHVVLAQGLGAEIHAHERVIAWEPSGSGVHVRTENGEYQAQKLILAGGAWMRKLAAPLAALASPERQVLGWFQPRQPAIFAPARLPVFNMLTEEGHYYGLPIHRVPGFKVGLYHHLRQEVDPDNWDRKCHREDEQALRRFIARYLPEANGPLMAMHCCLFTNTPDEHFILDFHPEMETVVLISPCSGHGFKFASVIGEIAADLATKGKTRHDISIHRLERFRKRPANA
jgi:sarcosine oxidase